MRKSIAESGRLVLTRAFGEALVIEDAEGRRLRLIVANLEKRLGSTDEVRIVIEGDSAFEIAREEIAEGFLAGRRDQRSKRLKELEDEIALLKAFIRGNGLTEQFADVIIEAIKRRQESEADND